MDLEERQISVQDIKNILATSPEYAFLKENPYLGDNIMLLGYGGSHAYGTNNGNSDVDIRGIATRNKNDILTGFDFEQVVQVGVDTTIYSFDKMIKMLCACNPNVIELLGLRDQDYIYRSDIGYELCRNRQLFLSKIAIHSFGGYANAQLRRLENKSARTVSQQQQEAHLLKTIEHASVDFKRRYFEHPDDAIKLYIDESQRDDYFTEIFCDVNLHHYPIRDYKGMFSEIGTIISGYSKIGKRNEKAIAHDKLGKHMMHLVRLYHMAFDILENGEIVTYREKDHDFLMDIRNGKYLDENQQPTKEFYEIVDEYEHRLDRLKDTTELPDKVDLRKVNDFVASVNERIVRGYVWYYPLI